MRSFKEVKGRAMVVVRFPNELSALVMVFSLLEEEAEVAQSWDDG